MLENTKFFEGIIREVIDEILTPKIIQESGLGGHMMHLYDDKNLKFSDIKKIFKLATEGELQEATEKLDGQSIFFTYNVGDGELRFARNKGNLLGGGFDGQEINEKWKNNLPVRNAFFNAYVILSKALSSLPVENLIQIFGPSGNVWFSAEIIYSGNPNVINYNQNIIVLHKSGLILNSEGKPVFSSKPQKYFNILTGLIDRMQNSILDSQWKIMGPIITKLQRATDNELYLASVSKLNGEMNKYNMDDSNTIADYIAARFAKEILATEPYLPQQKVELGKLFASDLLSGQKKNEAVEILDGDKKESAKYFLAKTQQQINRQLIGPLEHIIHDFAVKVLEGVHSALVLNPEEEVNRIKNAVKNQIDLIKQSNNTSAMEILNNQLEKLKHVDKITSSMEGVVFKFGNKSYKLTGNFAPINTLLGLFKYKRV